MSTPGPEAGLMTARWRAYVDRHATSSRARRLVARLGRPRLRAAEVVRDAVEVPQRPWTVSVVVPCYNYGHFLPETVRSALDQSGVEVEVIVVDDCSTDDSLDVARRLADQDPRVTVLANGSNRGQVRSFNRGWNESSGELVVRIDADDLLTPGALARAAAVFEARENVGMVYGHPLHFESGTTPVATRDRVGWTVWSGEDWLRERCRLGVNCVTSPEVVMRSSTVAEVGPLDPELRFTMDMEMWMRLSAVSDVAHVDGADQAFHREHPGSLSVNEGAGALLDLRERARAFERLFENVDLGSRREVLLASARRALAAHALKFASSASDRRAGADAVRDYAAFALTQVDTGPLARRATRLLAGTTRRGGRISALVRRAGRRFGAELHHARWSVTGV